MASHPRNKHRAYIGCGSNLGTAAGDSAATIAVGLVTLVERLGKAAGGLQVSSLYETTPVGFHQQPGFVNAVATLDTSLSPEELLRAMLRVELAFGRKRAVSNGPRTLDLDLLMVDDLVLSTATLVLPHPRMAERRFVLEPLAEIAACLVHPVLRRTITELLAALPDEGEQAISGVKRLGQAVKA